MQEECKAMMANMTKGKDPKDTGKKNGKYM
jgi:hypothetical protein